jgi:hypothetical protein
MKLLLAAAAGVLGYLYYCGRNAQSRVQHEELGRWEGEGGNVPSVATPTPAGDDPLVRVPAQQRH